MKRPPPEAVVATLEPPEHDILKREKHVIVWRERSAEGEPRVVKMYRLRGRLSALRSKLTRFRVEREYRRLRHLMRWGVPCTEPIAWAHGFSAKHGFHEVLVMREVPDAVPLGRHLRERDGEVSLGPLFRVVKRMHESGFCNQTLFACNVLVSRSAQPGQEFFIADTPRSWTFPRSIAGTSMALFDLRDLVLEVEGAGVPPKAVPLDAYGLSARDRRWWERHRSTDSRRKWIRLRRDAAARLRWALAWCVPRRRRRPGSRETDTGLSSPPFLRHG